MVNDYIEVEDGQIYNLEYNNKWFWYNCKSNQRSIRFSFCIQSKNWWKYLYRKIDWSN
jgi:hypothetical protein